MRQERHRLHNDVYPTVWYSKSWLTFLVKVVKVFSPSFLWEVLVSASFKSWRKSLHNLHSLHNLQTSK
jgi:hypothetical protein